jgi:hypothetical protein
VRVRVRVRVRLMDGIGQCDDEKAPRTADARWEERANGLGLVVGMEGAAMNDWSMVTSNADGMSCAVLAYPDTLNTTPKAYRGR